MRKRVTVVLEDGVNKKLLLLQGRLIVEAANYKAKSTSKSPRKTKLISFSHVVNRTLRKELT